MSQAETQLRAKLARNGRNPENKNAGIRVGSDLHLAEMILAERDELLAALAPFAIAFEAVTPEDIAITGVLKMSIQRVLFEADQPTISDLQRAHTAVAKAEGRQP